MSVHDDACEKKKKKKEGKEKDACKTSGHGVDTQYFTPHASCRETKISRQPPPSDPTLTEKERKKKNQTRRRTVSIQDLEPPPFSVPHLPGILVQPPLLTHAHADIETHLHTLECGKPFGHTDAH